MSNVICMVVFLILNTLDISTPSDTLPAYAMFIYITFSKKDNHAPLGYLP